ncbi:hypothetical protein cypCar_00042184 [Cyprinus carpio]|nr:hypothetical protein cypCar_00042184 [Cyprinus carpio]
MEPESATLAFCALSFDPHDRDRPGTLVVSVRHWTLPWIRRMLKAAECAYRLPPNSRSPVSSSSKMSLCATPTMAAICPFRLADGGLLGTLERVPCVRRSSAT